MIKIKNYTQEELIPIVAELAERYTGYEHSSITYEKAQMLMEAVLYCINEHESQDENILVRKHIPAKEAYTAGQRMVMDKVGRLKEIYNELILTFRDYGSVCLNDAIVKGVPLFLQRYDAIYAPQETLLTLDYPILKNLGTASGIDVVLEYVTCIFLEQQFFRKIDTDYIVKCLRAYHDDYEVLVENICILVLQNLIGHVMLNKPMQVRGFTDKEYGCMEEILQEKEAGALEAYLGEMLNSFVHHYFNDNVSLLNYLGCGIPDIAVRIRHNAQNHCLNKIFLL